MNSLNGTVSHSSDEVFEQVLEEITVRIQAGELIDLEACVVEYPEYAERLQKLLPAMQVLLAFGASESVTGDGPTSHGSVPAASGVLGDFRIIREIGRGGMGVVYEAEQISIGRPVALKVLPFASMLDDRRLARFRNEVRAAGQLHHTNIVPVYAIGSDRGVHFYAMQLVNGQSLAEMIAVMKSGRSPSDGGTAKSASHVQTTAGDTVRAALSTLRSSGSAAFYRTAAQLAVQAAEALEHAHSCGVVHRDIKPSNLLVDERGCLWLTDFGLASVESDSNLTMTGDLLGTLRYMSPEQTRGSRVVLDHRTDIYSLGATLYELLTLQPAFAAAERVELLRQINDQEPLAPHRINSAIPADLETIVLKAMSKDAGSRYATALHMADDLRRFLENKPIQARRPSPLERGCKWAARHSLLVAIAAGSLAIVAVVAAGAALVTSRAYRAEAKQRTAADANLVIASETIDRMLSRVSHHEYYHGDLKQAETLATDATAFYDELLQHNDDPTLRYRAAEAQNDLARIWELTGNHEKAIAACRRGVELLSPLVAAYPDDGKYLDARGGCYLTLGGAQQHSNLALSAEEPYRQAVADYELLVDRFPKEPSYQTGLAYALADIGTLCWSFGHLEQAEQYFARADKLLANLPAAGKYSSCDSCVVTNKGAMLMNRALVASDLGDTKRAKQLIEQAIAIHKQVLHDMPGDPQTADLLFKNYSNLGETCIKAGQPAAAASAAEMLVATFPERLDAYQQAVKLLIECAGLADQTADAVVAESQSASTKTSNAEPIAPANYNAHVTAQNYRLRAQEFIVKARHTTDHNPDSIIDFALFLLLSKEESFRDSQGALELAQGVVRDYPRRSRAWFTLALAHYRNGDRQAADDAEQNSIKFSHEGSADKENAFDWLLLSMIQFRRGRIDEARQSLTHAENWIAENEPKDQDLLVLHAEANELVSQAHTEPTKPITSED